MRRSIPPPSSYESGHVLEMESASDSLASSRLMASPSEVFEGEIVALIGENGAGNRRP